MIRILGAGASLETFELDGIPVFNQPEVMIGNASARFDKDGILTDETTKTYVHRLLENLVEWTRRLAPR